MQNHGPIDFVYFCFYVRRERHVVRLFVRLDLNKFLNIYC